MAKKIRGRVSGLMFLDTDSGISNNIKSPALDMPSLEKAMEEFKKLQDDTVPDKTCPHCGAPACPDCGACSYSLYYREVCEQLKCTGRWQAAPIGAKKE